MTYLKQGTEYLDDHERRVYESIGTLTLTARYDDPDHVPHKEIKYGSHWPMRELLAAKGLQFQDLGHSICVDPAE